MHNIKQINRLIISRTDSIGDVILSLPMAGLIKELLPECKIIFLGRTYTKDVVACCDDVDEFINWDELKAKETPDKQRVFKQLNADAIIHAFPVKEIATLAKSALIPLRIGTSGRLYHYSTCNKIVPLTRKRSDLHESQLNLKLLRPLGALYNYSLKETASFLHFHPQSTLTPEFQSKLTTEKFKLILHPKSKGSAREWGLQNFHRLIDILPPDKFEIYITGTADEALLIKTELSDFFTRVNNLTGKLSLGQLISFIGNADALLAASTGPLHIAAAVGIYALGIYPPIRPMDPGRWAPLGDKSHVFVLHKNCSDCRSKSTCKCMESITPEEVKEYLMKLLDEQKN